MTTHSEASHPIIRRGWLQLLVLASMVVLGCPVSAQTRGGDASEPSERSSHRSLAAMLQTPGTLDFIDLSSPGPGQRPRGALRFRFESATRALRGFGVEADECRTLFRSTSSRGAQTPGGGYDGVRIGVTVTLNCSFF
jgi:hypothetical protein